MSLRLVLFCSLFVACGTPSSSGGGGGEPETTCTDDICGTCAGSSNASAHGTRGIGMELQVHIVAPLVQCSRPMGAACGRRTARDALCELLRRRRRCWWRRVDRRRAGLATICQRARNER